MADAVKIVLKVAVAVIDRKDTNDVVKIMRDEDVRAHVLTLASGTAGTGLLSLLGLEKTAKSMVICLQTAARIPRLLARLAERLQLARPGRGIAFTIPLSGMTSAAYQRLTHDIDEGEAAKMDAQKPAGARKFGLILVILNEGHVEELMDAAREAGARGGTVLHGRSMDLGSGASFLGIAAQTEKDVVAILTTQEQKNAIMKAIAAKCGIGTPSDAAVFSLPVDDIEGLGSLTARGSTSP